MNHYNLVIIESPYKANTIVNFLGSKYKVLASKGHVRDLPKSSLGVDIENNFEAHYINIRGKGDLISALRKEAKKIEEKLNPLRQLARQQTRAKFPNVSKKYSKRKIREEMQS